MAAIREAKAQTRDFGYTSPRPGAGFFVWPRRRQL